MLTPVVHEICALHLHHEPVEPDTFMSDYTNPQVINPAALAANPTANSKQQALKEGL